MWTAGSRLFVGGAIVAALGGLSIVTRSELVGAAATLFVLAAEFGVAAGWCVVTRDSEAREHVPEALPGPEDAPLGSVAPALGSLSLMVASFGVVFDERWLLVAAGLVGLAGADWIVTAHVDTVSGGSAVRRRMRRKMLLPAAVALISATVAIAVLPVVLSALTSADGFGRLLIATGCGTALAITISELVSRRPLNRRITRTLAAVLPALLLAHLVL